MKKDSYEKLDDWFINLYEEWLFIRSFEYSAVLLGEILGYKVFVNIDKKTWFIFLELWFPKIKLWEVLKQLEIRWYKLRIMQKDLQIKTINWSIALDRNLEKLIQFKQELIKF